MTVVSIKSKWYDEQGNLISQSEKNNIKKIINKELDEELNSTGFEGFVKRTVIKLINK